MLPNVVKTARKSRCLNFSFVVGSAIGVCTILSAGCITRGSLDIHAYVQEEVELEEWRFVAVKAPTESVAKIFKGNSVTWQKAVQEGGFYLGGETNEADDAGRPDYIKPGQTLIGASFPGLVITEWSDNPARSYTDYLFSLEHKPRLIGTVWAGTHSVFYQRLANEPGWTVAVRPIWNDHELQTLFENMPEMLILKYENNFYHIDRNATARFRLTESQMERLCELLSSRSRVEDKSIVLRDLDDVLAILTLSGNTDEAYQVIERVCTTRSKGLLQYRHTLKRSVDTARRSRNTG